MTTARLAAGAAEQGRSAAGPAGPAGRLARPAPPPPPTPGVLAAEPADDEGGGHDACAEHGVDLQLLVRGLLVQDVVEQLLLAVTAGSRGSRGERFGKGWAGVLCGVRAKGRAGGAWRSTALGGAQGPSVDGRAAARPRGPARWIGRGAALVATDSHRYHASGLEAWPGMGAARLLTRRQKSACAAAASRL
jgi:hypothetical protein